MNDLKIRRTMVAATAAVALALAGCSSDDGAAKTSSADAPAASATGGSDMSSDAAGSGASDSEGSSDSAGATDATGSSEATDASDGADSSDGTASSASADSSDGTASSSSAESSDGTESSAEAPTAVSSESTGADPAGAAGVATLTALAKKLGCTDPEARPAKAGTPGAKAGATAVAQCKVDGVEYLLAATKDASGVSALVQALGESLDHNGPLYYVEGDGWFALGSKSGEDAPEDVAKAIQAKIGGEVKSVK